MRTPARILIADDNPDNVDILRTRLAAHGYEIVTAVDGEEALAVAREREPDLILLDVMMPKLDGIAVCRRLKADAALPFMPDRHGHGEGRRRRTWSPALEAGADEYLDQARRSRRARGAGASRCCASRRCTTPCRRRAPKLAEWNATLEQRVAEQLQQLESLSRLKRFFSPQLAEAIVAGGAGDPLASHRREVAVVFLDLRGFTSFAETSEPEEVMRVLREYHAEMGRLILAHEGTLERFTGDGMMIFFNDPVVVPESRGARAAHGRGDARARRRDERRAGASAANDLALGIGIAQGYATIGAHRLRRPGRLRRHRHRHESRRAPVRRGEGRADPDEQKDAERVRGPGRGPAGRRSRPQGLRPAGLGLEHHCPPAIGSARFCRFLPARSAIPIWNPHRSLVANATAPGRVILHDPPIASRRVTGRDQRRDRTLEQNGALR